MSSVCLGDYYCLQRYTIAFYILTKATNHTHVFFLVQLATTYGENDFIIRTFDFIAHLGMVHT